MNPRITHCLERLRDAFHEAIINSKEIADAMEAITEAGFNATLLVDVELKRPDQEPVPDAELIASDSEFLHSVGITSAGDPLQQ